MVKSFQSWYVDSFPWWNVSIGCDCGDWSERIREFFSIYMYLGIFMCLCILDFFYNIMSFCKFDTFWIFCKQNSSVPWWTRIIYLLKIFLFDSTLQIFYYYISSSIINVEQKENCHYDRIPFILKDIQTRRTKEEEIRVLSKGIIFC